MNHLVPTQRTDKNGRAVIRHMKPEGEVQSDTSSIPKVQGQPTPDAHDQDALKDEIFNIVYPLMSDDLKGDGTRLKRKLHGLGGDHTQKVLQVAKALQQSSGNHRLARYEADRFAETVLRPRSICIAYANLDIISSSQSLHDGYMTLVDLHQSIMASLNIDPGTAYKPYLIERMDSHIGAYKLLMKSHSWWQSTDNYVEYSPLVSKYPDHWERLCNFLVQRGGIKGFNDASFKEYLSSSTPSMAEGML